jgi:uncharacterized surface protein with fasciclin (FAS1) repeats
MKTLKLNLKSIALIAVMVTAVLAVSCNKDDNLFSQETVTFEDDALKAGKALPPGDLSIAEIAINAGFDELVAALVYVDDELDAGLVDLFLNGTDQYTVFAPTDDAFEELYDVLEVNNITGVDAQTVLNVLLYHVTEGRRAANSVVPKNGTRIIETLLGQSFSVNCNRMLDAYQVMANIIEVNISASNGVIHVIDTVILPDLD